MRVRNWQAHALVAVVLLTTGAAGQEVEGGAQVRHGDAAAVPLAPEPSVAQRISASAEEAPGVPEAEITASGSPEPALSFGDREVWGEWYERPNLVRPLRVGATMLGGAAGGLVAGGAVFLVSAAIVCGSAGGSGGGGWCLVGPSMLGVLTGVVAVPVSMWLTGNLLNGDGNFWATLAGTAGGALVGSISASALLSRGNLNAMSYVAASLLYGVTPFLCGALLYELTSSTSASSERRRRSQTLGVVPNLIATRNGGLAPGVALGGRWD